MNSIDPTDTTTLSATYLVRSPSALRTLASLLGVALVLTIIALVAAPWQQSVRGTGRVTALAPFDRIQTLAAPVDGRIRKAWVVEGSRVEEGDRILEIIDNDAGILDRLATQKDAIAGQLNSAAQLVAVIENQVQALERSRDQAIAAARSQVQVASAASRSAAHGLDSARAYAEQADLNYRRQQDLVRDGLVSDYEFEVAERTHRQAQAGIQQAQQALEGARSEEEARRSALGRIDTKATADIESARGKRESAAQEVDALRERIASFDSRIARQNTQLIVAPRAGTIFRLLAAPGAELVKAGDPLVTLIPDTKGRAVELWVDGNHVPLIDEGRPVRLQFEGWPGVQFAGWPSVAVGTFGGRVALVDPTDDGQGRFRLLIVPDESDEPWPAATFLRQGARAKGFVLLDQVSLGYELWRLANGFPPAVQTRAAAARGAQGNGNGSDKGNS